MHSNEKKQVINLETPNEMFGAPEFGKNSRMKSATLSIALKNEVCLGEYRKNSDLMNDYLSNHSKYHTTRFIGSPSIRAKTDVCRNQFTPRNERMAAKLIASFAQWNAILGHCLVALILAARLGWLPARIRQLRQGEMQAVSANGY